MTLQRLAWPDVLARVRWRQGEHLTALGPTGAGKTTAIMSALRERERAGGNVLAIVTKPIDPIPHELGDRGYEKINQWPPPRRRRHIVMWPRYRGPHDRAEQAAAIREALGGVFKDGGWCVYVDELYWLANRLGLGEWLRDLWLQGRSMGVTLVCSAQRPRNVPVEAYPNSSHILMWRNHDDEDLRRLAGMGAAPSREVRDAVTDLDFDSHELLWVDCRRGDLYVTQAPPPGS